MKTLDVNIDFAVYRKAFPEFVLEKAKKANSSIVYVEDEQLIEEDPSASIKRS